MIEDTTEGGTNMASYLVENGGGAGRWYPFAPDRLRRSGRRACRFGIILLAFLVLGLSAQPSFAQPVPVVSRIDPPFAVAGGPTFLLVLISSEHRALRRW